MFQFWNFQQCPTDNQPGSGFGQSELTTMALGECISALSSLRSFSAWTKNKRVHDGGGQREIVSSAVSMHGEEGEKEKRKNSNMKHQEVEMI